MDCNCSRLLLLQFLIMMLIFEQDMKVNGKQSACQDFVAPRQKQGLGKRSDVNYTSKATSPPILGSQQIVGYGQAVKSCRSHRADLISLTAATSRVDAILNLTSVLNNHTQIWLRKKGNKKFLDITSGNVSLATARERHWAVCLKKTRDVLRLCNIPNVTRTTYASINTRKEISFCVVGNAELDKQANVNGTQLRWGNTKNGFSIVYRSVTNRKYLITVSIDKVVQEYEGLLNVTVFPRGRQYSLCDVVLVKVRETTHANSSNTDYDLPVKYRYISTESLSVPVACVVVSLAIAVTSMTTYLLVSRCLLKGSSVHTENDKSGDLSLNKDNEDYQDLYSVIPPYETIKDKGVVRKDSFLAGDELESPIVSWLRETTLEPTQEPVYAVINKSKAKQIAAAMDDSVLTGTATLLSEETDQASFELLLLGSSASNYF